MIEIKQCYMGGTAKTNVFITIKISHTGRFGASEGILCIF